MKAIKIFTDYVKEGSLYDSFEGFKVLKRVLNPQWANIWAIVQGSDHSKVWKWCQHWSAGFGNKLILNLCLLMESWLQLQIG